MSSHCCEGYNAFAFIAPPFICVCSALQDSEQSRTRGVDVGDGKEAASERRADANGLDQMHADAARSGDDTAAASANDGLDQVRRLNVLYP